LFHDGNVDQHVTLAPGVDRFPPQKQKSKWFILFLRFTLVRTILPSVCTLLRCCGSACCYISDLRGRGFTSFGSVNDLSVLRQVLRGCVHCPLPWDQQISGIPGSNISNGAFGAQIIHVLHEDNLQKLAEFAQQPFRPMTHKPPATCPRNDIDYSALTSLIAFATGAWRRKPAEKCHKHSWFCSLWGMASKGVVAVVAIAGSFIAIGVAVYVVRVCLKVYRARLAEVCLPRLWD
jgi:hypothetical protein